jgi:hypothetical protein
MGLLRWLNYVLAYTLEKDLTLHPASTTWTFEAVEFSLNFDETALCLL